MKILLAGATGVIGRPLIRLLLDAGHSVTGTTRRPERAAVLESLGADPVLMDALDRASVDAAVAAARPDVIIHQLTDLSDRDFAGNARLRIDGTRHLVDAARAAGVERMIAQNISWIFQPGDTAATEADPINRDMRGIPQLEDSVGELDGGVVLRYGLLYGPGTWYSTNGMLADDARAGTLGASAETVSFVHVDDAAQSAVDALAWPRGQVNIVDDEPAHAADWMPAFAAAVGAPEPAIPSFDDPGRPVSNALARSRGWNPRYPSWRDGFTTLSGQA